MLFKKLGNNRVKTIGFADDVIIITKGSHRVTGSDTKESSPGQKVMD